MSIGGDVTAFLRTNRHIMKLNFAFGPYRVYTSAYQHDVAACNESRERRFG